MVRRSGSKGGTGPNFTTPKNPDKEKKGSKDKKKNA